jgi:hypothetical protein
VGTRENKVLFLCNSVMASMTILFTKHMNMQEIEKVPLLLHIVYIEYMILVACLLRQ